jgi:23S rRNA (pseudouridine1915-N3)-methyltransferase
MKMTIFAIGKPKLIFAKLGIEEYCNRLTFLKHFELKFLKEMPKNDDVLLQASEGMFRIALDEHGLRLTTQDLANHIKKWEIQSVKGIAFLIGGANGHGEKLKAAVDTTWRISDFTLQHKMACVILLEQIYRAYSLIQGKPYHRE